MGSEWAWAVDQKANQEVSIAVKCMVACRGNPLLVDDRSVDYVKCGEGRGARNTGRGEQASLKMSIRMGTTMPPRFQVGAEDPDGMPNSALDRHPFLFAGITNDNVCNPCAITLGNCAGRCCFR